jgi:hypothetical protein
MAASGPTLKIRVIGKRMWSSVSVYLARKRPLCFVSQSVRTVRLGVYLIRKALSEGNYTLKRLRWSSD